MEACRIGLLKSCNIWKDAGEELVILDVNTAAISDQCIEISVKSLIEVGKWLYLMNYRFYGSGDIIVEVSLMMDEDKLPELPRFGMLMSLPGDMVNVKWYGRGPLESYWDRKTGSPVGLYEGTVWDQHYPYVRPQGTGNKTEVRWMGVYNDQGVGLLAVGLPLISTCVRQYDRVLLEHPGPGQPNRHLNDVQPQDIVTWNIDYRQMGVGGDNSWGARTHEKYTLFPQNYSYSYRLRPFDLLIDDLNQLNKQKFEH